MNDMLAFSRLWIFTALIGGMIFPGVAIAKDPAPSLSVPTSPLSLITTPPPIPAKQIGAGKSLWVESEPSEEFKLINARVDIGTLRRVGDAFEVQMRWPNSPGELQAFQEAHPDVKVSAESQFFDREQVVCRAEGMLSYRVESTVLSAQGQRIYHQTFDPVKARAKEEAFLKRIQTSTSPLNSYGSDPRSLVCWAAARKCDNTVFSWPPPPNNTPLEDSERATKMRADYYKKFFPTCR